MSRIIIHKRKSGKFDYTITGDDVNENILVATVQGFERRKDVINNLEAVYEAIYDALILLHGEVKPMTHAQYTEFMRKHRNQQARNRRAMKVKK